MPAIIQAVQPVLMSNDVSCSVAFYKQLGFAALFKDDPVAPKYAAVVREGVELHLQWNDLADLPAGIDRPNYRFRVSDVDQLFDEYRAAGALDENCSVRDTPWGTREFHVRDPAGNGLQFHQPR